MKVLRIALPALAVVVLGIGAAWLIVAHAKAGARNRTISPDFTITRPELESMVGSMPSDISERILATPDAFLALLAKLLDEPAGYFVLVDKTHPIGESYLPPDLVRLTDYPLAVARNDLELRKAIMPEVVAMSRAAKADGVTLLFSSTYRSYSYQTYVYNREVRLYGKKVADSESAVPGTSQHQLGTAIDFGSISDAFEKTAASRWLVANAWEYGFSLSYPQGYEQVTGYRYESWHYRYITKAGAQMQRRYFDDIQAYLLLFLHDNWAALEASRVPQAKLPAPSR